MAGRESWALSRGRRTPQCTSRFHRLVAHFTHRIQGRANSLLRMPCCAILCCHATVLQSERFTCSNDTLERGQMSAASKDCREERKKTKLRQLVVGKAPEQPQLLSASRHIYTLDRGWHKRIHDESSI